MFVILIGLVFALPAAYGQLLSADEVVAAGFEPLFLVTTIALFTVVTIESLQYLNIRLACRPLPSWLVMLPN